LFTIKKYKLLLLTRILGRALKIYGSNYDRSTNRRSNYKRIRSSKKKLQNLTRRLRRRFGVGGFLTVLKRILTGYQELTEEERATIFVAPEFLNFVEQSSKIVQRALNDNYDYTRDYTVGAQTGE
jgi:hypothetical protein